MPLGSHRRRGRNPLQRDARLRQAWKLKRCLINYFQCWKLKRSLIKCWYIVLYLNQGGSLTVRRYTWYLILDTWPFFGRRWKLNSELLFGVCLSADSLRVARVCQSNLSGGPAHNIPDMHIYRIRLFHPAPDISGVCSKIKLFHITGYETQAFAEEKRHLYVLHITHKVPNFLVLKISKYFLEWLCYIC